jgi:hypothetical protein
VLDRTSFSQALPGSNPYGELFGPTNAGSSTATAGNDTARQGPPGRGLCTEWGDYWIVPDDTRQCYANVQGEQITESEFARAQAAWDALRGNTGHIQISETDGNGTDHAGFRAEIMGHLGRLMSRRTGRELLIGLVNGTQTVTIRPSSAQIYGGGHAIRGSDTLMGADGTPSAGGTTTIELDPGLRDTDVLVYDRDGNEISLPVFVTLGHELIHASHNATGSNRRNEVPADASYGNREEELTISEGTVTENDLRREHGLTLRHGHQGSDTRSP